MATSTSTSTSTLSSTVFMFPLALLAFLLLSSATVLPASAEAAAPPPPPSLDDSESLEQFRKATAVLQPLLAVLPKNEEGKLGDSAVKYALHHFFVRKFAWHVRGLEAAGQSWNQTSLLDIPILKELPEDTQALFRERLKAGGLTEHECTVLAVTIWQLIHQKSEVQLLKTFHFFGLHTSDALATANATKVVSAYMAAFVLDRDISKVVPAKMMQVLGRMEKVYPRWPGLQRIVQQEVSAEQARRGSDVLSYSSINRIRENVDERFGYWQMPECLEMKELLLNKEDHGTGRIRLADFYKAGLDGNFQFQESVDWLRELGALEESSYSGGEPRVIIENYISGASNSIGSSPFHDSRCISECENLMETIQLRFSAPSAPAEELSGFVSSLPSRTVKAPRDLGTVQRQRLTSIAQENGGSVPLTGRLFAQWMHHSYPRECPYPHLAGSTNPHIYTKITEIKKGISSKEQMASIAAQKPRQDAPILTAPWQPGEELPAPMQAASGGEPPRFMMQLHLLLLLAVFACSVVSVGKLAFRACRGRAAVSKANRQLPPGAGRLGQQPQQHFSV